MHLRNEYLIEIEREEDGPEATRAEENVLKKFSTCEKFQIIFQSMFSFLTSE